MNRPNVNTTPLFRTSLRDWQASWKARQAETGNDNDADRVIVVNQSRSDRFTTRKRRRGEQEGDTSEAGLASN